MALKNNTWTLNAWYDQDVGGNVDYSGKQQIWFWGGAENGLFGDREPGTPSALKARSSPTQMGADPRYTGAGYDSGDNWVSDIGEATAPGTTRTILATKTDGTLWGWGKNTAKIIKAPSSTSDNFHSPYQIPGTTWAKARFSTYNASAIKTDGTLWAWGENDKGQLGQNSTSPASYSSPIQIGTGTDWNDIHAFGRAFLANKTDGTLWAWGEANNGRLGINAGGYRSSPTQVPGTTWSLSEGHLAGGGSRAGAIKTDGTLWVWGANSNGDLGVNNRTAYSSPIQVPGTWSSITVGGEKMLATKTDGTLWGWGNNYEGSLGLNNNVTSPATSFSSPVQIGSGTDWREVGGLSYAGGSAIKTDGTAWTWGYNGNGTLGVNDITQRSSPVQIPGNWANIQFIGDADGMMGVKII